MSVVTVTIYHLTPCFAFVPQEENSKETVDTDPNKKPPYSYVALIAMAIKESAERKLQVGRVGHSCVTHSAQILIHEVYW